MDISTTTEAIAEATRKALIADTRLINQSYQPQDENTLLESEFVQAFSQCGEIRPIHKKTSPLQFITADTIQRLADIRAGCEQLPECNLKSDLLWLMQQLQLCAFMHESAEKDATLWAKRCDVLLFEVFKNEKKSKMVVDQLTPKTNIPFGRGLAG